MRGLIQAVCRNPRHGFSKQPQLSLQLLAGLGVKGDAHCGETVQHVYLKRRNAAAPNLMQVHLLPTELLDSLAQEGFNIQPGELGENITTHGLDLEALPLGARLHLGDTAVIELTCLRAPCKQIETFRPGLLKRVMTDDSHGHKGAKAGVMSIVLQGGSVFAGDAITIDLPEKPHRALTFL